MNDRIGRFADMGEGMKRTHDGEEPHMKITRRQNARRQIPKKTLEQTRYDMRIPVFIRAK